MWQKKNYNIWIFSAKSVLFVTGNTLKGYFVIELKVCNLKLFAKSEKAHVRVIYFGSRWRRNIETHGPRKDHTAARCPRCGDSPCTCCVD